MVGKYVDLADLPTSRSTRRCTTRPASGTRVKIRYIDPRRGEPGRARAAGRRTPSWCRPVSANAHRRQDRRARYARESKIPYLGICLGMQVAAIEFARNVVGLATRTAPSRSQFAASGDRAGDQWQDASGRVERRSHNSNLGRHHAPGVQKCRLVAGSKSRALYNAELDQRSVIATFTSSTTTIAEPLTPKA